jgi:hypothetical protein
LACTRNEKLSLRFKQAGDSEFGRPDLDRGAPDHGTLRVQVEDDEGEVLVKQSGHVITAVDAKTGKLQLVATERLVQDAEQLTPDQSLQAEIYLALAHVNAGQAVRAEELFAKLRDRIPANPRVLEAQAECYMQLARYAQARELWRQLLGLVRENTPAWFRAKYNLALACFHTNDLQQCQKIIQVTTLRSSRSCSRGARGGDDLRRVAASVGTPALQCARQEQGGNPIGS